MAGTEKIDDSEASDLTGKILGGAESGITMQTRFTRIPDSHMSPTNDTLCGIRDMNLGRIKNGQPVGASIIRVDRSVKTGDTHINIDLKGFSNKANPHIQVSENTIKIAQTVNATLKYLGMGLTVAAVTVDLWRFGNAVRDDIEIKKNAPKIIQELEETIAKLKEALTEEECSKRRQEIKQTIEHLQVVLKDVQRINKGCPAKSIKKLSSIAGGWSAGAAGGAAGAWAGAVYGAAIGSAFGPVGTVVGGPIGATAGAFGFGIGAGIAGSAVGEYVAEKGMQRIVD